MKLWILALVVFIFAISLRLWNLNMMGRWWDESWYMEKGYAMVELIKKGDFTTPFWYTGGSDHPPFTSYMYGLVSYKDLITFDPNGQTNTAVIPGMPKGAAIFNYDVTWTRLVSVVISSIAVLLVFLFGVRYFSLFVGIAGAMILAMIPHFLGLSQLVVLESWMLFFFTACVFSYIRYLETNKVSFLILTGILTGMNLLVKQSDVLIFVFYIATYFVWRRTQKKVRIPVKHFFYLGLITLLTCIVLYPGAWLNVPGYLQFSYELWFKDRGRIPELVFGIHMGARSFFYLVAFLVTTPLVVMILSFIGLKVSWDRKKQWIYLALIIWFLVPFLMSFFHHRQHMVRYIIQFYAPLSLLAAIGFEYIILKLTKSNILKYSLIAPLFAYLMIILVSITPYYLNYFNELVGGTKTVYEKRLFFIGWFGEGLRSPGKYLEYHAPRNAKIGMALNPEQTLYKSPDLHYETFDPKKSYDYVVLNYFIIIRNGFDKSVLDKDYEVVYEEKADGAVLAWVYKHK